MKAAAQLGSMKRQSLQKIVKRYGFDALLKPLAISGTLPMLMIALLSSCGLGDSESAPETTDTNPIPFSDGWPDGGAAFRVADSIK